MNRIAFDNLVRKMANSAIDVAIRATLIGYALGKTPSEIATWSNRPRLFQQEASALLPNADPRWFDLRGTEMSKGLLRGAARVLGSTEAAEEILGEFFSPSTKRVPWGESLAHVLQQRGVFENGKSGFTSAYNLLFNRGKQWALDTVRSKAYRTTDRYNVVTTEPGDDDTTFNHMDPSTEWNTQFNDIDRVRVLMNLMNRDDRVHDKVLDYLRGRTTDMEFAIIEKRLEDPTLSAWAVAEQLGVDNSTVGKYVKRLNQSLVNLATEGPLGNIVDLTLQSEGSKALRMASKMKPLVRILLETRPTK